MQADSTDVSLRTWRKLTCAGALRARGRGIVCVPQSTVFHVGSYVEKGKSAQNVSQLPQQPHHAVQELASRSTGAGDARQDGARLCGGPRFCVEGTAAQRSCCVGGKT